MDIPSGEHSSSSDSLDKISLVSRYLELLVERTLVGDGLKPLPVDFILEGGDDESAFAAFLKDNDRQIEYLKRQMSPDQESAALALYQIWFSNYLKS